MAVVAAGVHFPLVLAGVLKRIGFLHGQRIHVCAQANGFVSRVCVGWQVTLDHAHHASDAQTAVHLKTKACELFSHQRCGPLFLVTQLWVRVYVTSDTGYVCGLCLNRVD